MILSEFNNLNVKRNGYFNFFSKLGGIGPVLKKTITFVESKKYLNKINDNISCVICKNEFLDFFKKKDIGIIISENPKKVFYEIYFDLYKKKYFKYFKNNISENAQISEKANISKYGVKIGNNCIIEDNVIIKEGSIIENNVIIRSNSVISSEGFEIFNIENKNIIIPHTGKCIIKDNVEVLNNSCIAKGLFEGGDTVIEEEVKVDNLVQIAHGVKIGKKTKIASGVVISGGTVIGSDSWLGPNATVSSELFIGNNVRINIGSVVINDLKNNSNVSGNFAYENRSVMKDFIKKFY